MFTHTCRSGQRGHAWEVWRNRRNSQLVKYMQDEEIMKNEKMMPPTEMLKMLFALLAKRKMGTDS